MFKTNVENILRYRNIDLTISPHLVEYSPWLASFSSNRVYDVLENGQQVLLLPGQFSSVGCRRPLESHLVQVIRFEGRIQFLSSKQKPCKLQVLGSDARLYKVLIKNGEDLRQDQRIVDLKRLCNDCFRRSAYFADTWAAGGHIKTYCVTPLAETCGWLEWMDDVFTLLEVCQQSRGKIGGIDPREQTTPVVPAHQLNIEVSYYNRRVSTFPRTWLRDAVARLCGDAPSWFLTLRRLLYSSASLSAVTYILGIGDRHLSNIMLDVRSASLVNIDFGMAFGSATYALKFPEMVPFRMTPQMRRLIDLNGDLLHFKMVLSKALKSLFDHKEVLEAVVEIFVAEPTVEWLQKSERVAIVQEDQDDDNGEELGTSAVPAALAAGSKRAGWFPERRTAVFQQKLSAVHPIPILISELRENQLIKPNTETAVEYLCAALDWKETEPSEAQHLSVEEVAETLVRIAGNDAILARLFTGYRPWF